MNPDLLTPTHILHHATHLEVQMVDGGEGAQAVVAHAEAGIIRMSSHLECEEERGCVDALRDAVKHVGDEEDVAILDGRYLRDREMVDLERLTR